MTFIVATNVVASRPPERRPTGTPHARAKNTIRNMYSPEELDIIINFSIQVLSSVLRVLGP